MSDNRLYQSIAGEIRKLIDRGEFPPGSRLPGERDLAERFGVSRVTIREAEIALEAQGLISIRIGSGVYVKARQAPSPGDLPDVTAFDLTAARAVIEAEAAAMAASRVTESDLEELRAFVQVLADPEAQADAVADADRRFHLAIARIAGNPVVEHCVQLIWRIRNEAPRVREVHARVCHDDGETRRDEHMAIFDALRNKDSAGARNAMRNHFKRLFEAMLEATENQALEEIRRRTQADRERFITVTSL